MDKKLDYNAPLISYFPVPDEFLNVESARLANYISDKDDKKLMRRTLNSLSRGYYSTLGHVLRASWFDLTNIRSFGSKSQFFLFEILQRVSDNPEQLGFASYDITANLVKHDRMKRLIHQYEKKTQPSFDDVLKRVRMNEIKRKLKSLGMIE